MAGPSSATGECFIHVEAAVHNPSAAMRGPRRELQRRRPAAGLARLVWVAPLDRLGSPEGSSNYVRSSVNAFTVLKPVDTVRKGGVDRRCVLVPEGADHGAADHNCRRRFRNWFSLSAASA